MDQLTPTDSTHVLMESGTHIPRIVDGYIFDADGLPGSIDLEDVLEWVRPRIEHSAVFRSRIQRYPRDVDFPYWVPDPDFDLRNHVTVEAARGPGWPAVRDRIAVLCGERLPPGRPPWELLVITGITEVDDIPDGSCVVVLKVHHAVGDGMETVELARGLFAQQPLSPGRPTPAVTPAAALLRAIARAPVGAARLAWGSARAQVLTRAAAKASARGEVLAPRWRWPSTRFNRRQGPGFTFDAVTFDLAEIGAARSRFPGITVTDVVIEVIANAMVSYLREHGEEPPESLGGKVSYSTRGTAESKSRNNFVVLSVDLHTDIADPIEQLHAIHDSMDSEKRRFRHPAVAELSSALECAPAPYVNWLVWRRSQLPIGEGETVALGNTMISNVPRQSDDMRFLGSRLIGGFGVLGIGDGSCLNHYIVTVGTRVTVTFGVDPARMPDTGRYLTLLREAFDDLARACLGPVPQTRPADPPL
ncbi:wax ester/triacylglycerol synthase domain-containing protein [Rhodococcus sp. NPDC003322]